MARRGHSSGQIERALRERETHGWSYAETSRRTGIPTGTLAGWARRLRLKSGRQFVQVVAAAASDRAPAEPSEPISASARIAHPSGSMIELDGAAAMLVARGVVESLGSCR